MCVCVCVWNRCTFSKFLVDIGCSIKHWLWVVIQFQQPCGFLTLIKMKHQEKVLSFCVWDVTWEEFVLLGAWFLEFTLAYNGQRARRRRGRLNRSLLGMTGRKKVSGIDCSGILVLHAQALIFHVWINLGKSFLVRFVWRFASNLVPRPVDSAFVRTVCILWLKNVGNDAPSVGS